MYDWLTESLHESGSIITANRRLARILIEDFGAQQLRAGAKAWQIPDVSAWQDWLVTTVNCALQQESLPTRINAHQSQWLWERCLSKEIGDAGPGMTNLVRLSRDTWQRLADWQVSIGDIARAAQNSDQRMFAAAAGRYLGILHREHMVDDAGLASLVLEMIAAGQSKSASRYTFAGFDRQSPIIAAIQEAMVATGTDVRFAPRADGSNTRSLQAFENSTAELRSAGAWARNRIEENPAARIAIVAHGLDGDAEGIARRVREGVTPGWQHGHRSLFSAVNVSYGRRLSEYPAIAVALTMLRWLVKDLSSTDVGLLLRSPLLSTKGLAGRSRLELRLRQLPDRAWTPSMIGAELRGRDNGTNANDWMTRLAVFSKRRRKLPKLASPAEWAVFIDETLTAFNWPGQDSLDSTDFQLINRWRELLNEFARLGLVSSKMAPAMALARIEWLAGETVFQPESTHAVVQLMGPLEASGSQFDAIWLSGISTANWPPAGTPSALVSRRLQEKHGMPDCTPEDTLRYAELVLTRLVESADTVVCSYALTEDDAEQTASDLLTPLVSVTEVSCADPGWYAASLTTMATTQAVPDSVPAVTAGEQLSGGAATIQRQITDPVSAFVQSRMGAKVIYPQATGIPARLRGNLIHDALYQLYVDLPSSEMIRSWQHRDLTSRIDAALNLAFARHEKNTDAVLLQLLALERRRVAGLLRQFVAIDGNRDEFQIEGVEGSFEFVAGHIRLPLRFDRLDRFDDGSIAILDYKTGSKKRLINRDSEPQEIQLFVYACATEAPVSALALINVDSREISFDGGGRGYTDVNDWPELLERIKSQIAIACKDISNGDVRINIEQGLQAARPLNLLTRYSELRRDNG